MLRRGDDGNDVLGLQKQLTTLGFPCGRPDGDFGGATQQAVSDFQTAHGLEPDGIVGDDTADALRAALRGARPDDPVVSVDEGGHDEDDPRVPDLLGEAVDRHPATPGAFPDYFDNGDGELARGFRAAFFTHPQSGRSLAWKGRPRAVDLADRTHVCLHITAVEFGTSARRRQAWVRRIEAGEISEATIATYRAGVHDQEAVAERMALHERFWTAAYHWVGLLNGDVLYNNAPERYTYHGNGSNAFAIGVSAEADLPGIETDRRPSHTRVTDHFIDTNRETLRLAISNGRRLGAPLTHATAHRCFSMTRAGDPGEAYWQEVAIPVCRELDVAIDYGLVDGGRPIGRDWDPDAPGHQSARVGGGQRR